MKKLSQIYIVIAAIIIFILIILFMWHKESQKPQIQKKSISVATMIVKPQDFTQSISALGHIESAKGVIIKANVSGPITQVHVKSGQNVHKGDILIEINPDAILANLSNNEAQTTLDKLNLDRYKKLYQQNAASQEDLDTAQANYTKDLAQTKLIEAQLNDAIIRAPFDGNIGIVLPKVGQYVNSGDDLLSLQNLQPVYVNFSLPSKYQAQVKLKQAVNLTLDAYTGKIFTGYVSAIDNKINQASNSILVRAIFTNQDNALLPGDLGNISVITSIQKNAMIVPAQAINYDNDATYIYKIIDNKAHKQTVSLGQQVGDDDVIVTNGLAASDMIVSAGTNKLSDNATVQTNAK